MNRVETHEATEALDHVLDGLVADGVVPGGVAVVAGPRGVLWERAFGRRAVEPAPEDATLDTLWDAASLTKPLVTAALWLEARAAGLAAFDQPVDELVPEMRARAGEPRVPTLGELLLHAGGLPAWKPMYALAGDDLPARAAWLARHREEPGRRAVYGCPGYQVLGLALERLHGRPLGDQARALFRRAEGEAAAHDLVFGPVPAHDRARTAPTEHGNAFERGLAGDEALGYAGFRDGLIRGDIHDHNAHGLGGAGNAGLFATGRGVARLATRFLAGHPDARDRDVEELSRDLAPHLDPGGESRTWGFQLARSLQSPAGDAVDDRAFGHAGFTGTSVLVDPSREAVYVLLTNRVHPRWTERAFHADRKRFHAAAAAWREAHRD